MEAVRRSVLSADLNRIVRSIRDPGTVVPTTRRGLTILELLVATGIVTLLIGIVLPACGAAREAARRIQCSNHLRQIGLALANYHDTFQTLPAGWQWESSETSAYGWAVPLLPYLEQAGIYATVDRNRSLLDSANNSARGLPVFAMRCPSDIAPDSFELFAETDASAADDCRSLTSLPVASYVGVFGNSEPDDTYPAPLGEGAFIERRPVRLNEFQRGLSHTIVVSERTAARLPSTWLGVEREGEDATCRLVGNAATSPNCSECDECEFSSRHNNGVNSLWADGRVSFVNDSIDRYAYRELARRGLQIERN